MAHLNKHDARRPLDVNCTRANLPSPNVDVLNIGLSDHRLLRWSSCTKSTPRPRLWPGPEKPDPISLKCGLGRDWPGRILGFVPPVIGQMGEFTRGARPVSIFCIPAIQAQPSSADVLSY